MNCRQIRPRKQYAWVEQGKGNQYCYLRGEGLKWSKRKHAGLWDTRHYN